MLREPVGRELLVLDEDVLDRPALPPPAIGGKEGRRRGTHRERHVGTEGLTENQPRAPCVRGRRHDDQPAQPVSAGPARDGARLGRRAVGAARDDLDGARRHAERAERDARQLVLLGKEHAAAAQRRLPARQLCTGEGDARGDPQVIEARRLERAVGERAGQHHDGVGVRWKRIGDHQEPSRSARGEHDAGGEEDHGEEEPPEPH